MGNPPGPGDHHGCPYRHFDEDHLAGLLSQVWKLFIWTRVASYLLSIISPIINKLTYQVHDVNISPEAHEKRIFLRISIISALTVT